MDVKFVNALTLNNYHLIRSTATDQPYMGNDLYAYMFYVKMDAERFFKTISRVSIDNPMQFRQEETCSRLYGLGFEGIHLKEQDKDSFTDIPISYNDTKKQFFNPEARRNILLMKQNGDKQYFYALKEALFLIPTLADRRELKAHPTIHYSYASFPGNGEKYYLLFTSIQEFEKWKKTNSKGQELMPLGISLMELGRIRKDSPVFINPESDKVILTNQQIKKILSH